MKKRMTLVIILNDEVGAEEGMELHALASKTNSEWEAEMRQIYGADPAMALESVKVEDV